MIYVLKFLYSWLLPPAVIVLLLLWLAWRMRKKDARLAGLTCLVVLLLYAASIRPVAEMLLRPLEYAYPLPQSASGDVVIVLGGGSLADVPLPQGWSGQVTDGPAQRLLGAYILHRRSGLPVVASGGEVFRGNGAEAQIMRDLLVSLGMEPGKIVAEAKSLNTQQNAEFTARLLRQYGWQRPVLVTSAFHMRRAVAEFKRAGVVVTPYPVGYSVMRSNYWHVLSWVPSADALYGTSLALKEYLGLAALMLRSWGPVSNYFFASSSVAFTTSWGSS